MSNRQAIPVPCDTSFRRLVSRNNETKRERRNDYFAKLDAKNGPIEETVEVINGRVISTRGTFPLGFRSAF